MKHFLRYQVPLVLWALTIFFLSSIPTLPPIKAPIGTDKLIHIGVYFIFCWLSYRALFYQERIPSFKRHALVGAFLLTSLYGYLDEVHQLYVVGRSYDLYDWAADIIGASLCVLIIYSVLRGKRKQETLESTNTNAYENKW